MPHTKREEDEADDSATNDRYMRVDKDDSGEDNFMVARKHERGRRRNWGDFYRQLEDYKKRFGNTDVPQRYVEDRTFGAWVHRQRRERDQLSSDQKDLLNKLNFSWETLQERRERIWNEKLEAITQFRKVNGDFRVSADDQCAALSSWMDRQRSLFKKNRLRADHIARLNAISFVWEPGHTDSSTEKKASIAEDRWMTRYERLVDFRQKYGHCRVPYYYEPDEALGRWVKTQRTFYQMKDLSDKRIDLLNRLGFSWTVYGGAVNESPNITDDPESQTKTVAVKDEPHEGPSVGKIPAILLESDNKDQTPATPRPRSQKRATYNNSGTKVKKENDRVSDTSASKIPDFFLDSDDEGGGGESLAEKRPSSRSSTNSLRQSSTKSDVAKSTECKRIAQDHNNTNVSPPPNSSRKQKHQHCKEERKRKAQEHNDTDVSPPPKPSKKQKHRHCKEERKRKAQEHNVAVSSPPPKSSKKQKHRHCNENVSTKIAMDPKKDGCRPSKETTAEEEGKVSEAVNARDKTTSSSMVGAKKQKRKEQKESPKFGARPSDKRREQEQDVAVSTEAPKSSKEETARERGNKTKIISIGPDYISASGDRSGDDPDEGRDCSNNNDFKKELKISSKKVRKMKKKLFRNLEPKQREVTEALVETFVEAIQNLDLPLDEERARACEKETRKKLRKHHKKKIAKKEFRKLWKMIRDAVGKLYSLNL